MAEARDPTDQFREVAQALAEGSRFDQLLVGLVYHRPTGRVIAMRAELIGPDGSASKPRLENVESPTFCAFQARLPISDMGRLLDQIKVGVRLLLPGTPGDERLGLDVPDPTVRSWIQLDQPFDQRRAAILHVRRPSLDMIGVPSFDAADAEIRAHSKYQWTSLPRLIFGFCQQKVERSQDNCELQIIAPWPLGTLSATRMGKQIKLELIAATALDLKRLIVNVEGFPGDARVPAERIRWLKTGQYPDGLSTFSCLFEPEQAARAVNVFVDGIPQVFSRSEVHDPPDQRAFRGTVPIPPRRELSSDLRLVRIELTNYKLLRSMQLDLTPLTVVVGPNQAGKSTLLDAIRFLSEGARGNLSETIRLRGGYESFLWRSMLLSEGPLGLSADLESRDSRRLRYQVQIGRVGLVGAPTLSGFGYFIQREALLADPLGTPEVLAEIDHGEGQIGGRDVSGVGTRELMLSQLRDPGGLPEWEAVRRSLASCALFGGFDTSTEAQGVEGRTLRGPARPDADIQLSRRAENLSAALYLLKESAPQDWELLMGATRLAFPRLKDIRFPAYVRGMVHLRWIEQDGTEFDPSELSDGSLTFLATACALLQRDAAIIGIDEPEMHLHPDAIRRIIGLAESVSQDRQILLTTQSSNLLGFLDERPESIVIAQRGENGARLFRPNPDMLKDWLKEFGLGEIRFELETWSPE